MAWTRNAYTVLAALTLLLVTVQFVTAGVGLFGASDFDLHEGLAGIIHLLPLLMLIVALLGRLGRFFALAALGLLVLITVQFALPGLRDDVAELAALHPLNALVIWYLAHMAFLRSRAVAPPAAEPAT